MFYLPPALFSRGTVKSQLLASWPTLGATQAPRGAILLHSKSQHCFFLLHLPHLAPQPSTPNPFSMVVTTHPRERPGSPFQVLPSWIFPQDKIQTALNFFLIFFSLTSVALGYFQLPTVCLLEFSFAKSFFSAQAFRVRINNSRPNALIPSFLKSH